MGNREEHCKGRAADVKPWHCDSCKCTFTEAAITIGGMPVTMFERNAHLEQKALEAQLDSDPHIDLSVLQEHHINMCCALGPRHGISVQALYLLCNAMACNSGHNVQALVRLVDTSRNDGEAAFNKSVGSFLKVFRWR